MPDSAVATFGSPGVKCIGSKSKRPRLTYTTATRRSHCVVQMWVQHHDPCLICSFALSRSLLTIPAVHRGSAASPEHFRFNKTSDASGKPWEIGKRDRDTRPWSTVFALGPSKNRPGCFSSLKCAGVEETCAGFYPSRISRHARMRAARLENAMENLACLASCPNLRSWRVISPSSPSREGQSGVQVGVPSEECYRGGGDTIERPVGPFVPRWRRPSLGPKPRSQSCLGSSLLGRVC